MEEPLSPREFLHRYNLPQLVRIDNAHLHQLNTSNKQNSISVKKQNRSSVDSSTGSSCESWNQLESYSQGMKKVLKDMNNELNGYQGVQLDLDQPFLLYKAYSSRQVIAHTLDTNGMTNVGCFKPTGPALLIPDSYTGWFSLVTNKGKTAGYFSTIDEIGRAQIPYFLTRDEITAYISPRTAIFAENPARGASIITSKCNGNFSSIIIEPGTVLRFLGVYEDISAFFRISRKNLTKTSKKKTITHNHGLRYAKCLYYHNFPGGEIVYIPITTIGRFYVLAKNLNQSLSYNHVYSISNLLRIIKLPATVQLIIGPKPKNFETKISSKTSKSSKHDFNNDMFTAVLRLEEIRMRDVILGCTIRPQPFRNFSLQRSASLQRYRRNTSKIEDVPVLLEFDLDSCFNFVRTFVERDSNLNSRKIPDLVVQRISFCSKEADAWRRQIKVAHDIVPRPEKPLLLPNKKSIFEIDLGKNLDKTASIGSRASNTSNISKISRVLQRFWNPLKKPNRNEFERIKEDLNEDKDSPIKSNNKILHNDSDTSLKEYHYYETLKKSDENLYLSKPRLTRKQTLDIIFPDSEMNLINDYKYTKDDNKLGSTEESGYSTIR